MLIATVLVGLLLLIVGIGYIQKYTQQSAIKKVSDHFVEAVLGNDANSSYSMLTATTQNATSLQDWQSETQKLSSFFNGSQATYNGGTTTQAIHTATYSIPGTDGKYTLTVVIVKESGTWHVQSFNSQLES